MWKKSFQKIFTIFWIFTKKKHFFKNEKKSFCKKKIWIELKMFWSNINTSPLLGGVHWVYSNISKNIWGQKRFFFIFFRQESELLKDSKWFQWMSEKVDIHWNHLECLESSIFCQKNMNKCFLDLKFFVRHLNILSALPQKT